MLVIKSKDIEQKLFEKISDTEKTLAIHVILTQRHKYAVHFESFENRQNTDSITKYQMSHYEKDTLLGMFFRYNGLQWYYSFADDKLPSITSNDVMYARKYWKDRIRKIKGFGKE